MDETQLLREINARLQRIEERVSRYQIAVAAFCGSGWAVLLAYVLHRQFN